MGPRGRRACALVFLVAVLAGCCGTALLPVRTTCGQVNYACATAPDPVTGRYRLYYEWEPLAVTIVETLASDNFRIFYTSGYDELLAP